VRGLSCTTAATANGFRAFRAVQMHSCFASLSFRFFPFFSPGKEEGESERERKRPVVLELRFPAVDPVYFMLFRAKQPTNQPVNQPVRQRGTAERA
jgi:hypothetical protein